MPPAIDESVTRLVRADADLVEEFIARAQAFKMQIAQVKVDDLNAKLIQARAAVSGASDR